MPAKVLRKFPVPRFLRRFTRGNPVIAALIKERAISQREVELVHDAFRARDGTLTRKRNEGEFQYVFEKPKTTDELFSAVYAAEKNGMLQKKGAGVDEFVWRYSMPESWAERIRRHVAATRRSKPELPGIGMS